MTESFSASPSPVPPSERSPSSSQATMLGVTGGPLIGTRSAQGWRRRTARWPQAQRDSPARQSSSGAGDGGAPTAASTMSASSSSLAETYR